MENTYNSKRLTMEFNFMNDKMRNELHRMFTHQIHILVNGY